MRSVTTADLLNGSYDRLTYCIGVSMMCTNRSRGFQLEVINIVDVVVVISDWLREAGGAPCRRLDAGDGR